MKQSRNRRGKDVRDLSRRAEPTSNVLPKQKRKSAPQKARACARDLEGGTTELDDTLDGPIQLRYESWLLTRDVDRICR